MKKQELKGLIVARNTNYTECAKYLGVSVRTFQNKMNKASFSIEEASKLTEFLEISNPLEIFFEENVT